MGMRRPRGPFLLWGSLAMVVALVLLAMASVALAQPQPTTWKVWNGLEATQTGRPPTGPQDLFVASNDFQPRPLEISVGDSVEFINGGNFHTVAIGRDRLPPFEMPSFVPNLAVAVPMGGNSFDGSRVVQSGFMEGPGTFKVTFTQPGEFKIVCDLHDGMEMSLRVRPAGEKLAMTPQQADQAAMSHYLTDWTNRVLPLLLQWSRVTAGEMDGVVVYDVAAGFGDGHVEGLRFLPQDLVVRAGDWVRWTNPDPVAPHTITLFPGGGLPEGPPPEDPAAAVALAFTPTDNVYDGMSFVNQVVVANPLFQPPGVTDRAAIQFVTPGEYTYVCLLHLQTGMMGKITVLPR